MAKSLKLFLYDLAESGKPLAFYLDFLDPFELKMISRMSNEKRKLEFAAARFILKTVLKRKYQTTSRILLDRNNGKPYVKSSLKFNLSHSKNRIALAVSEFGEVGVDVETKNGVASIESIADRYFGVAEKKFLGAANGDLVRLKRFRTLWSLKESYIKAIGGIISDDAVNIHFDLVNKKLVHVPHGDELSFIYNDRLAISVCALNRVTLGRFSCFSVKAAEDAVRISPASLRFKLLYCSRPRKMINKSLTRGLK